MGEETLTWTNEVTCFFLGTKIFLGGTEMGRDSLCMKLILKLGK